MVYTRYMGKVLKLKPCPFCGGRAHFTRVGGGQYKVACDNAGCIVQPMQRFSQCKSLAAMDWNRRGGEA